MTNLSDQDPLGKLTLDTHILIWYAEGIRLTPTQVSIIDQARSQNLLYIAAISLWEIAMLAQKDKIAFAISLDEWIENILSTPGLNLIDLSVPILVESCNLPNFEHKDPADRLIISSARSINSHLMTFDQKINDYAADGYLKIVQIDN
jgi:PIN domain nuclease of toxin-antitoxin system